MLTEDELPSPPLRRTAGEHRGQSLDDLSLLPVRCAAIPLMRAKLLQRSARTLQPLPELLRSEVALRALVRDAPKLAGLELHVFAEPPFVRRRSPRDGQESTEDADGQTGRERKDRDRHDGHGAHPR